MSEGEKGRANKGNSRRPVLIPECDAPVDQPKAPPEAPAAASVPVALAAEAKSAAPAPAVTLGATLDDGDLNPQTASFNSQLTLMLRAAQRGYEIPDGLASCQTLAKEANESGLGALFVDEGWQPAAASSAVLYAALQACALEEVSRSPAAAASRAVDVLDIEGEGSSRVTALTQRLGASRTATDRNTGRDQAVKGLFGCPLRPQQDEMANYTTHVPDRITALHERLLLAGMRGEDPHATARYGANEPLTHVDAATFESNAWPRPVYCGSSQKKGLHIDVEKRQARPGLFKLQNPQLGLEVRPMLKSASTLLKWAFNCTHNGMWKAVPQYTTTPPNYTVALVVRDPVEHFASGVVEVMSRLLRSHCPEGPCNEERDTYQGGATLDKASQIATWLRFAVRELGTPTTPKRLDESRRRRVLTRLVRAAAMDTTCNLRYYASEHLISQTGLMVQGDRAEPHGPVRFFAIESIGGDLDGLLRSELMSLATPKNWKNPSAEDLARCLAKARGTTGAPKLSLKMASFFPEHLRLVGDGHEVLNGNEYGPRNSHNGGDELPSTAEVTEIARADATTMRLLYTTYAQDYACLPYKSDLARNGEPELSEMEEKMRDAR